MHIHSDSSRESDPHALPNIEVFYVRESSERTTANATSYTWTDHWPDCGPNDDDGCGSPSEGPTESGWYWQACFSGCMPDGEPNGPFATEAEAIADAQDDDESDDPLPPCVQAMGCYCAGHARGNPVVAPCDTSEETAPLGTESQANCHPDCGVITVREYGYHQHENEDGSCTHESCIDCGATEELLWERVSGIATDNFVCVSCGDKRIEAGTWDSIPNDCSECARSYGPHYTGACKHGEVSK